MQYAGIEALDNGDAFSEHMIELYRARREKVLALLGALGWEYEAPKGTFYLWAPVPEGHTSAGFCDFLFDRCAVVASPGAAYGEHGEGYIRFSLTVEDARLDEAIARMRANIPRQSFA